MFTYIYRYIYIHIYVINIYITYIYIYIYIYIYTIIKGLGGSKRQISQLFLTYGRLQGECI